MKLNLHYAIPGVGLALSLPLLLASNPTASFLGGASSAASVGYLCSTLLLSDETKKAQQAIARQETVLNTREHELSIRFKNATADLQQRLAEAIADRDRAVTASKAHVAAVEAQRRHLLAEAKAAMGDELRRQFEAEYAARFATATADFQRREDEFYHAEGELCEQIEALQVVVEQNEAYLKGEFDKETSERVEQFAGKYKELRGQIAKYGEVIQMASSEAMEELKEKDLIIARLKGQVELLSAPKKYRGNSQDDGTANKVLEFFLNRGIGVEAEDWQRQYHQLKVLLFPKGGKLAELAELADDLQIALGLYARPRITIENSLFAIECDTDAKVAVKATIKEPPLSKLERAISDAIHVRIAAPSGSGKSVLLGNLVNYLTETYLSTYQLYDPKVTDREVWGNLTPTYYSTDCLPALFSLAEECLKRIDLCKAAAENNAAPPAFSPEFHIIDELEFMYSLVDIFDSKGYTPKKFAINVKTGLKVGREHKIKLLFVTQSALCTDVNLKKNDFFNTTSLFLGQTIVEALDSDLMSAVSAEKKAVLKAEYKARLARGDKYTILVYEPEKPTEAWLCTAPSPGYYSAIAAPAALESNQDENTQFKGGALLPLNQGQSAEKPAQPGCAAQGQTQGKGNLEGSGADSARAEQGLAQLLAQGTHCPDCGYHSSSYKSKRPTSKGNVSLRCKNKECSTKTFSWKVI